MRVAALVASGLLSFTTAASAATRPADVPRAEAFGAYSYARAGDEGLHGWSATFGYNFTRHLELEAELGAHYGGLDDGTELGRQGVLAGPRLNLRAGGVTPFVRALAGAVRNSAGITVQGVNISARDTSFAAAAGGGVDVSISRHWGLRLQGDYLMIETDGDMVGDPRAAFGVSYRLGRKNVPPRAAGR